MYYYIVIFINYLLRSCRSPSPSPQINYSALPLLITLGPSPSPSPSPSPQINYSALPLLITLGPSPSPSPSPQINYLRPYPY
jgi:hypothetical protein